MYLNIETCKPAFHSSEDLVPVTNRRCLCELAKQIGFTEAVAEAYTVQDCLAVFRHLVSLWAAYHEHITYRANDAYVWAALK